MCFIVVVCTLQIRFWTLEFRLTIVVFHRCYAHTTKMWFMKFMDIVCVHNVVCVVCTIVPILGYWSSSTLLFAFVYTMFIVVPTFEVHLCFLCVFCSAKSWSMTFNLQGCCIMTWCALCHVHLLCMYIYWNSNRAHQLGIEICYHYPSIVRIIHCAH